MEERNNKFATLSINMEEVKHYYPPFFKRAVEEAIKKAMNENAEKIIEGMKEEKTK